MPHGRLVVFQLKVSLDFYYTSICCTYTEVVRAMNHVIDHGWIMYWGTSRWSSVEISEAYNNCRQFNCPLPICEQSEYHFLCREKIEISLPEVYNKLGLSIAFQIFFKIKMYGR